MTGFASPQARAVAAAGLLGLCVASLALLIMALGIDLVIVLADPATPPGPAPVVHAMLLIWLPVFIISVLGAAISVPIWTHRAYRNLRALGERSLRWSPSWAAAAWFIPLANLVIPYLVVRELWLWSGGRPQGPSPAYWWATWTGSCVVALGLEVAVRVTAVKRSAGDLIDLLATLAAAVAGVFLILLILQVSRRQRASSASVAPSP